MTVSNKEKIRKIYEALPKINCGLCGFGSCGKFARAVAEERASPFSCKQDPWAGYTISEIVGPKVPVPRYRLQPASPSKSGIGTSLEDLRQDIRRLSNGVDDILVRIEKLRAGGNKASKDVRYSDRR